jgi:hypothetical protein
MPSTRTVLVRSTAVVAVLAASLFSAAPASASGKSLVRDGFEGSVPLTEPGATPIIAGVSPGGAPWVLDDKSNVRLREDGRITVKLVGLVIPGRGNPVAMMAASLVCDDMVVSSTDPFMVDAAGNGRTKDVIHVPDDCDDPVVLIRNATDPANLGAYFAFTDDHDKHDDKHDDKDKDKDKDDKDKHDD